VNLVNQPAARKINAISINSTNVFNDRRLTLTLATNMLALIKARSHYPHLAIRKIAIRGLKGEKKKKRLQSFIHESFARASLSRVCARVIYGRDSSARRFQSLKHSDPKMSCERTKEDDFEAIR